MLTSPFESRRSALHRSLCIFHRACAAARAHARTHAHTCERVIHPVLFVHGTALMLSLAGTTPANWWSATARCVWFLHHMMGDFFFTFRCRRHTLRVPCSVALLQEALLKTDCLRTPPSTRAPEPRLSPPAFSSLPSALLLGVRYTGQHGGGDSSRLRHVHDYVASELNRLVPAKAGAMVLVSLAGTLLGIKTRLQLTDGMLPAAELTSTMLHKCPGWAR